MGRVEDLRRQREAMYAAREAKTANPPPLKPKSPRAFCARCGGSGLEPPSNDKIGKLVKEARVAMGLSQANISREVGCSQSLVAHMEAGRRPWSGPTAQRLLSFLRVAAK